MLKTFIPLSMLVLLTAFCHRQQSPAPIVTWLEPPENICWDCMRPLEPPCPHSDDCDEWLTKERIILAMLLSGRNDYLASQIAAEHGLRADRYTDKDAYYHLEFDDDTLSLEQRQRIVVSLRNTKGVVRVVYEENPPYSGY